MKIAKEKVEKVEGALYRRVYLLLLKALNDNISRPKIWRKIITFCRATGYDGLGVAMKIIDDDDTLSKAGKSYIIASIISEISYNIIVAVKNVNKPYIFANETERNKRYIEYAKSNNKEIKEIANKYHIYYINEIILQYDLALCFAECENYNKNYFNIVNNNKYALKYLWYCTRIVVESSPSKMLNCIDQLNKLTDITNNSFINEPIKNKLLQMYPDNYEKVMNFNGIVQGNLSNTALPKNNYIDGYVNLNKFINENIVSKDTTYNHFDMVKSEWDGFGNNKKSNRNNKQSKAIRN